MNQKRNKLFQQLLNVVLVIVIVGLLGWLSNRYKTEFDWTYGHRNTLSQASQKLLKTMPDPIHFYAFIYNNASNERSNIQEGVDRYKRFKHNVTLSFIDPSRQPQKVKEFNITQPGQLVVEYDGRREILDQASEPKVSNALERLSSKNNTYVAFLGGHGEHSIHDKDQNGYSDFAQALKDKGMHVLELNLVLLPKIPYNTSALVIASPKSALLPAERKVIANYVNFGGNLLWLADTDNSPHPSALAEQLGITWQNGYAVFPNYRELGTGNPGIYLAAKYPNNPITKDLKEITVFPWVRSLEADHLSGWHTMPLLTTSPDSWLEASPKQQGVISFDPKAGDIPGPLTIGLAEKRGVKVPKAYLEAKAKALASAKAEQAKLEAKNNTAAGEDQPATAASTAKAAAVKPVLHDQLKEQRVVMIGDADFLANGNIKVLGNRDLGVDVINWLASRDTSLNISIPKVPDHNLYLPGWTSWLISAGYIIVLPLLLILFGVARWIVRRRR